MRIHREGYKIILFVLASLIVLNTVIYFIFTNIEALWITLMSASLLFISFILMFFREPDRKLQEDSSAIYSAADGKVVAIEEVTENEYFNEKRLQISVFMSIFNVHSNYYPVSGQIKWVNHQPGKYYIARHPKSSLYNERSSVVIRTDSGMEIMVRQIAGAVARRIVTASVEGEQVKQGDELGFIKFGSRVDIFLPQGIKANVKLNQEVRAKKDIVAIIE